MHSFIFKLFVLECVFTTSLSVHIEVDGSALTCIVSESDCLSVTINCEARDLEEVEWLNPNNVVINSTKDRIYTIDFTGLMIITNPQVTDSGMYTCRAKANHSENDEVMLTFTERPTFAFSSGFIYEEKIALFFTDVFINCSVDPTDTYTSWEFENKRIINNDKYSQNISGLTIHNVTEEDQGHYICFLGHLDPPNATILLSVVWPPRLFLPQNRTMKVSVKEEVILNCSASASPDPVYSWSFPDSCSSCPNFSNNSVMIFTAKEISDGGDYICVAENDYGTVTKLITIHVLLHIEVDGSALTCVVSESDCSSVTINCQAREEIEWLNPNNVVINSTETDRIHTIAYTGLMMITNPQVTDSGRYTCRAKANHSENDELMLTVKQRPTFAFSSGFIYEEKTALLFTDVFFNCSVDPIGVYTSWEFNNKHIINNHKYNQSISGLTIHNVTEEDQGHYICFIGHFDPLNATTSLNVVWPPKLFLPQNRTKVVNVSEEVILNCSASGSPDPVYTWSTPDSCSSCPKLRNDSVVIFIADISKSGDYICVAENDYGTNTKQITINVLSRPLIATESVRIIMEERNNLVLTCGVQYAYPLPTIEWSILAPLSNEYTLIQENSTNYQLHRNGSFEILHRFLFEMGYMIIICSATNVYGSNSSTFYLWEHETFMRRQEFKIYVDNITNCEDLEKDKDSFQKMADSLREWFDSACEDHCNGHNNLYTPQLTCINTNMGIVSSIVHHEGENSAQMLIDLAIADVQARNPPVVHLSHGWMLRLNQSSPEQLHSSHSSNKSQPLIIGVGVGVAVAAVILLLIVVGTGFGIYKRYLNVIKIDGKDSGQTEAHIYDEVGNYATARKSHSVLSDVKDDNVIFEVSTSQTPTYQPLAKSLEDSHNKTRNEKYNDYSIDGEDNSKVENVYNQEEKYLTIDHEKEQQNDHPYNKLMHLKQ